MSKEINLLPLRRRRQLARAFWERQLRHFLVSLLWGAVLLTVAAVSAGVGLSVSSAILFPQVRDELEQAIIDYRKETKSIQARNALVTEMQTAHTERIAWSERLPEMLAILPAGTTLEDMSGVLAGRELTIAGRAAARSTVVVLEEKLRALSGVKAVEAPHSNLLERTGPEFRFQIKL